MTSYANYEPTLTNRMTSTSKPRKHFATVRRAVAQWLVRYADEPMQTATVGWAPCVCVCVCVCMCVCARARVHACVCVCVCVLTSHLPVYIYISRAPELCESRESFMHVDFVSLFVIMYASHVSL